MKMKRIHILLAILILAICAIPFRATLRRPVVAVIQVLRGKDTVADRVGQFGAVVRERLAAEFDRIGEDYPPAKIILVAIKQDNLLEVWVSDPPRLLKSYPILGASGVLGPKLQEGDMQVPEGLYRIASLNPNSLYHLALRLNYPNAFDKAKGRADGREDLGCDIMIHGKDCSIGCLAMGDEAAEDLFVLAAETGMDNISVILSPVDFRTQEIPAHIPEVPEWTPELYALIKQELMKLEDPQWREAGVHLWNASDIAGDVRWVPGRKSYEVRSRRGQPEIHRWIDENDVAWITLANGAIWKDYRKPKDHGETGTF